MNDIKTRYLELLQYFQDLESQGKSFWIGEEKYLELLSCMIVLKDHFYYQKKDQYVWLLKDFINRKIDGKEFETKFFQMFYADYNWDELLKTDFELDPQSKGFWGLLTGISVWISRTIFEDCDDPREEYEYNPTPISEKQLRNICLEILLFYIS